MLYRLRLLRIILKAFVSRRLPLSDNYILNFRAFPGDVDLTRLFTHSYFSFMALGRWDYILRSGVGSRVWKYRWNAITVSEFIQYKRSIRLFQKFSLRTRLAHIEGKSFYFQHTFFSGDVVMAEGYSQGLLKGPSGVASAPQVLAVEKMPDLAPIPENLKKWIESQH